MRALVPTGKTGRLTELAELPDPIPAAGQALVRVRHFSLNRPDYLYLATPGTDFRPGIDAVGTVEIPADGGPARGTPVVFHLPSGGAAAELVAVPADSLAPLPAGLSPEIAACLPLAGMVALRLLKAAGPLSGRRLLATGATGGVGQFLVQLAIAAGAQITVVAREDDAWRHLAQAGATVVHDVHALPAATFDVVLESVGGTLGSAAATRLRQGGLFLWYGQAGGQPLTLDFFQLLGGGMELTLRHFVYLGHSDDRDDLATLLDLAAAGTLQVEIGHRGPWQETSDVLESMAAGRLRGKAVLTIT
ncbi:zinc-binding dehydrogenase [Nonomuraea sp. NN258]|uniref:zinc-binding dehydrogenase n=1 Tax=Nonomuraea antri TaxID=2730852 RepID=UPI00156A32AC|nr:zinc-binding dehydrogenase [Nonomuraea antri]NRQ31494.1 zinc-binding dehydrogenase [Nonomuraea antri]